MENVFNKFTLLLFLYGTSSTSGNEEDVKKRFLLTDYHWGPWSRANACSVTDCQKGSFERQRSCYSDKTNRHADVDNCNGANVHLILCTPTDCKNSTSSNIVNGNWGAWSNYSGCSHTCGRGFKIRHRNCDNPAPSGGGEHCHGSTTQGVSCHHSNLCPDIGCADVNSHCVSKYCTGSFLHYGQANCKKTCGFCTTTTTVSTTPGTVTAVNGHWSAWGSPSQCSTSCGTGYTVKHRFCNNPAPSGGGHYCQGSSTQKTYCYHHCASAWNSWSQWSQCSVSCEMGVITRHRTCNQHGSSLACTGNQTETHECSAGACAEWSHWFNGDCSVSCGSGTRERLRHCSTGRPTDCAGKDYEHVPCTNPICI